MTPVASPPRTPSWLATADRAQMRAAPWTCNEVALVVDGDYATEIVERRKSTFVHYSDKGVWGRGAKDEPQTFVLVHSGRRATAPAALARVRIVKVHNYGVGPDAYRRAWNDPATRLRAVCAEPQLRRDGMLVHKTGIMTEDGGTYTIGKGGERVHAKPEVSFADRSWFGWKLDVVQGTAHKHSMRGISIQPWACCLFLFKRELTQPLRFCNPTPRPAPPPPPCLVLMLAARVFDCPIPVRPASGFNFSTPNWWVSIPKEDESAGPASPAAAPRRKTPRAAGARAAAPPARTKGPSAAAAAAAAPPAQTKRPRAAAAAGAAPPAKRERRGGTAAPASSKRERGGGSVPPAKRGRG